MHRLKGSERLKNRLSTKFLLRRTHFLALNHIAHTTNFGDLVDLVVSCGGEDLKQFVDQSWEKCSLHIKRCCSWLCWDTWHMGWWITPCKATKCLLQFACRWHYSNRRAVSCMMLGWEWRACWAFHEIIPLKKADAQTIYKISGWLFEGKRSAD